VRGGVAGPTGGVLLGAILMAPPAIAAPVLRAADIQVTVISPASCEVTMELTVDRGSDDDSGRRGALAPPAAEARPEGIEHRIEISGSPQTRIELLEVRGAARVGGLQTIGRTQSLVVRPENPAYAILYRATQSADRAFRCPMWLPTVPTDGVSRTVRFDVILPAFMVPGRSMPALAWTGTRGSTTIGHVPAFVRVPYAANGEARAWDLAQLMDMAAVVVFAGASALWIWRRRR
jgi:hypothetical protein